MPRRKRTAQKIEWERQENAREDAREEKRRKREEEKRPWYRKLEQWGKTPKSASLDALWAIAEFFDGYPEHVGFQLHDALANGLMPAADIKRLLTWWHNDLVKRKTLNKVLCIYDDTYGSPTGNGPEWYLAEGWWYLDAEQQEAIKESGKMTADDVWMVLYADHGRGSGNPPECEVTWEFLDDWEVLLKKHGAFQKAK